MTVLICKHFVLHSLDPDALVVCHLLIEGYSSILAIICRDSLRYDKMSNDITVNQEIRSYKIIKTHKIC